MSMCRKDEVLGFLSIVKLFTRRQVQELYFKDTSERYCNKFLSDLVESKLIKRKYFNISDNTNSYVYYTGRCPSKRLLKHDLLITECIIQLLNNYSIKSIEKIPSYDNVIPDAHIQIRTGTKILDVFLEVQLSPNDCWSKYYNFSKKYKSDNKPLLYIVTDLDLNIQKLRDVNVVVDSIKLCKLRELIKIDKTFN